MAHGGAPALLGIFRAFVGSRRVRLLVAVALAAFGTIVVGPSVSVPAAAAEPDPGPCVVEAADEASASAMAMRCGAAVEVLGLRSETLQVWAQPDATFKARLHGAPQRFQDGGVWRELDLTLEVRPDGSVAPKAHPRGLVLAGPNTASEVDLVSVRTGADPASQRVSMTWTGVLPAPVLEGHKATYVDALPGIDVQVVVSPVGFEQFLVVKSAAALARVDDARLGFKAGELSPVLEASGGIAFKDAAGNAVVATPTAWMWDAAADPAAGLPDQTSRVGLGLDPPAAAGAAHRLRLLPDQAWLADPARQFPITIDPGLTADKDLYVRKNSPNSNYIGSTELLLGTSDGGSNTARSFLRWDWSPIFGKSITYGKLLLWEHHAYSCTAAEWQLLLSSWVDHTTTWNNMPGGTYYSSSTETRGHPDCTGDGWVSIDAKSLLQKVADGGYAYNTMLIKAASETNNAGWKRFNSDNASGGHPYLDVTYVNPPSVTAVKAADHCTPSCSSPTTVRVTNPPLQAAVSDPAGTTMKVNFEIWNAAKTAVVKAYETTSGNATVTWNVPSGALANGSQYHFRVKAKAEPGASSVWSAWSTFTVNTAGPGAPTNVAANGDCYVSCSSPAMLRNARPTLKASVTHPFGDSLTVTFEVWNGAKSSVVSSGSKLSVAAGTTPTWQPASNLPQNQQMHLRVKSTDTYNRGSAWSAWYTFTVDQTPPGVPGVDSPLYRDKDDGGGYSGGVGVPGVFTFTPGTNSADIVQYKWKFNTGTENTINVSPGASASVTIVPAADLEQVLEVYTVDGAGWVSTKAVYRFLVRPQPVDVAYWKLNGTTSSESGDGAYTGVLSGVPAFVDTVINPDNIEYPGVSGKGLQLDGVDDHMAVPKVLATDHAAGFSVAAWVKPSALTTYHTVVAQQGANTYAFRIYYKPESNRWCLGVRGADDSAAATYGACSDTIVPQVGVWTHLTGVYDPVAGRIRLYVNGGTENQYIAGSEDEASAPDMWAANGTFHIGRSNGTAYFSGVVDEVRVFQRAVAPSEARQLFVDCWRYDCTPPPAAGDPEGPCRNTTAPMCVGEWTFEENTGATAGDLSDQDNVLTFHGAAAWTGDGYAGSKAVSLDGTPGSYLDTAGPVLLTDQSFSVSVWAKLTDKNAWRSVVTQDGTYHSAFRIDYEYSIDRWCFLVRVDDTANAGYARACEATAPKLGAWTHLVGVYDAGTHQIHFYVNGKLAASATHNTPWKSNGPLAVGRVKHPGGDANGHNDWFIGQIDLLRTYQGALSPASVRDLFDKQVAAPTMAARWDFDETEGDITEDYSGNGHTGQFSATGVAWQEEGREGFGVAFDGTSGSVETAGPVLSTAESFSVSVWAKLIEAPDGTRTLLAQDGVTTSGFYLGVRLHSATGNYHWMMLMHTGDGAGPTVWAKSMNPIGAGDIGQWVHLIGVYDAMRGEVRLYVNGNLQETASRTSTPWQASGPLTLGRARYAGGPVDWFRGWADTVQVFQGAFTDERAKALFEQQNL